MLITLAIDNYRSIRRLRLPLGRLTVVSGANGTGKSNLYRALRLLADSARVGAVAAIAREGGLPSALWAGSSTPPRRNGEPRRGGRPGPTGIRLGFAADDFGYAIDLGPPPPSLTAFHRDPIVKVEAAWWGPKLRASTLLAQRHGTAVRVRTREGEWQHSTDVLRPFDSMLSEIGDPVQAPELMLLRDTVRSWRFYDHVRTDAHAPARNPQIGTRTPVLSHDGADLAAALQTIVEIGDVAALDEAVDEAFPGSQVRVDHGEDGLFRVALQQPGLLRPLNAAELSDGTLRYLLLVAALLTPRPPELLVLNEPETSLHPQLLPPLANLIAGAAKSSQIVVVTHARPLVNALEEIADERGVPLDNVELARDSGETTIAGQRLLDEPPWEWPKR